MLASADRYGESTLSRTLIDATGASPFALRISFARSLTLPIEDIVVSASIPAVSVFWLVADVITAPIDSTANRW